MTVPVETALTPSEAGVLGRVQILTVRSESRDKRRQSLAAKELRDLLHEIAPDSDWSGTALGDATGARAKRASISIPISDRVILMVATAAMDAYTVQRSLDERVECWRAMHVAVRRYIGRHVTKAGPLEWADWVHRAVNRVIERKATAQIAAGRCEPSLVADLERVREWRVSHDGHDALATSRTRLLSAGAYRERGGPNDFSEANDLAELEIQLRTQRWGEDTLIVQHARVEQVKTWLREAEQSSPDRRIELAHRALPTAISVLHVRERALGLVARDTSLARRLVVRSRLLAGDSARAATSARVAWTLERRERPALDQSGETMLLLALALRDLEGSQCSELRHLASAAEQQLCKYASNSHDARRARQLMAELTT